MDSTRLFSRPHSILCLPCVSQLLTKQLPELAMKKTSENARAFIWTAPLSSAMRDDPENARTAITSL
eukprot:4483035-Prymnesium_polylepis.1